MTARADRPPDKERAARGVNPGGLEKTDSARSGNAIVRSGRAEAQGIALDRNPSQPAPRWPDAPGTDAARLLERLWGRR